MNIVLLLASFHTNHGLSDAGKERVAAAARILNDDPSSKVVITGGELAYGTEGPHHAIVSDALAKEGIGPSRILEVFTNTRHTVDEAEQMSALNMSLLQSNVKFDKLFVVTSFVHYPRAPFIFAHFMDLSNVVFVLVPDKSARDLTLFNYLHEFEAYQEDRRRGGLVSGDGKFIKTEFSYQQFTEHLRKCVEIRLPDMKDFELPETETMNLFSHYEPNSPFGGGT